MAKIFIIANMKSRSGSGWSACAEALQGRSDVIIRSLHEHDINELIQEAVATGCQTVVAAGGDGTISAVADAILRVNAPVRLGTLPTGTLNHFAKDLSIPMEPAESLRVIDAGHSKHVDAVRMNDRHFINNSSLGLYPAIVKERERLQERGLSKWFALGLAFLRIWARPFSVTVRLAESAPAKKVASIFIGNNRYGTSGSQAGKRCRLDEGVLFVALLRTAERGKLLRLAMRAIKGQAYSDPNLDVIGLQECTVDSSRKTLSVAYDGEVVELAPPITYRVLPGALRVIVPAGT